MVSIMIRMSIHWSNGNLTVHLYSIRRAQQALGEGLLFFSPVLSPLHPIVQSQVKLYKFVEFVRKMNNSLSYS